MKTKNTYFSKGELLLWSSSTLFIILAFLIFDRQNYLTLIASLIGVTSLIFAAKGNPVGMVLMIIFSIIYGYISFSFAYYGEMLTYLGMTMPMSVFSLISWLTHLHNGKKAEVSVGKLKTYDIFILIILTSIVTVIFYFILKYFKTANLIPSTVSVTTSFIAVYLTFRRSPYFAIVYALNDLVLIVLWVLASLEDISYLSLVACFLVFFINDNYGFFSWKKIQKRQGEENKRGLTT